METEVPRFSIRPYRAVEDQMLVHLNAMRDLDCGDRYPRGTVLDLLLLLKSKCLIAVGDDNALLGFLIYVREDEDRVCKILRIGSVGIDFEKLEIERIAIFIAWELLNWMLEDNKPAIAKAVCSLNNTLVGDLLRNLCFELRIIIPGPGDAVAGLYTQLTE